MKLSERHNQLPIYDIKDYERSFLDGNQMFIDEDKKDIPYVIHRMRRSKTDSELYDDRSYIYNENESDNKTLNHNQIEYIKSLAVKFKMEYDYNNGIHSVYKFELDFGNTFNNLKSN